MPELCSMYVLDHKEVVQVKKKYVWTCVTQTIPESDPEPKALQSAMAYLSQHLLVSQIL